MTSLTLTGPWTPAFTGGGIGTPRSIFLAHEDELGPLLAALRTQPHGRHSEPYMKWAGNCEALTPAAIRLINGFPPFRSANGLHAQGVAVRRVTLPPESNGLSNRLARWIGRTFYRQINWLSRLVESKA